MKSTNSNNQFIKKFIVPNQKSLKYIYNREPTFHVSEGPVRAGKTSDNIIIFAQEIEKSPDSVFLTIGQTQSAAKAILWEHEGLGLAHYPDWQERKHKINGEVVSFRQRIFKGNYEGYDALILLPKKDSEMPVKYIVAFGGTHKSAHEPYKGWGIGMFLATQWELLHANTRSELLKRTVLSRHRKHVIDLNPTSPNHEIYKEFDRWLANGDVNFIHKLMQDNPVMTEERRLSIMQEYDPDSVDYKRDILGLRVAAEGLIYNVRDYNKIDSFNVNDYFTYVISADPGQNTSATTFGLIAITKDRKYIDVLKSYWHRNADEKGLAIKMPLDYAKDFQQFIRECIDLMGKPPYDVLSDNDLTFVREFNRTKYSANLGAIILNHTFAKEEINDRIKQGINLLWKGRFRIHKDNPKVIEAFETASYNEKERDKGVYVRYDNPKEGTMIDPIDMVEYAWARLKYEIDQYRGERK